MIDKDEVLLESIYNKIIIENADVKIKVIEDDPVFDTRIKFQLNGSTLDVGKSSINRGMWGVAELFVPEENRRQGIASKLLLAADNYIPSGYRSQVSNDSSVYLHYKVGFRSFNNDDEELSLEETLDKRKEWSSVMMVSPNFISGKK